MDVTLINPFLNAVSGVFENMFGVSPQAGAPYILADELKHRWEISGILGITGDFHGLVGFRLPRLLGDKMLQKSGIETKGEEDRIETVYGMVGELTNIIAGNASSAIDHASIDISPPIVIRGEHHQITWPKSIPVIAIPYSSPMGPFEIDVCIDKKK